MNQNADPTTSSGELYRKFQPRTTSRIREEIEWSITYSYNARDLRNPRLLLIGDSICNGYQGEVRNLLADRMNVTFWASSKCVTDPDYFRELEFILDGFPYSVILFNNGLHSLSTDRGEWEQAFRAALRLIRQKHPGAELVIVNSTPTNDSNRTDQVRELNAIAARIAETEKLRQLDLFEAMDPLDRKTFWRDAFHFTDEAIRRQAELVAETALAAVPETTVALRQQGTETGPDGPLN